MTIFDAIRNGEKDLVEKLIGEDKSIIDVRQTNIRNEKHALTPLIYAIEQNKTDIALFLIDQGADIHAAGRNGFDALINCMKYNDPKVARVLLDQGASYTNSSYYSNETALMVSISDYYSPEIVNMIIKKAEDDNKTNEVINNNKNIQSLIKQFSQLEKIFNTNPRFSDISSVSLYNMKVFLAGKLAGATLYSEGNIKKLFDFVELCKTHKFKYIEQLSSSRDIPNYEILKLLGANSTEEEKKYLLIDAISAQNAEISKFFINEGIKVDTRYLYREGVPEYKCPKQGYHHGYKTALHWAVFYKMEDIIRELAKKGARHDNDSEYSPFLFAIGGESFEACDILLECFKNINVTEVLKNIIKKYHCSKNFEKPAVIKYLLNAGAKLELIFSDPNLLIKDKNDLLGEAIINGHVEISKYLIEQGVDLSIEKESDFLGAALKLTLQEKNDLLHSAVVNGLAETSKYLINKGAIAGYRKDGVPLIHLAAQNKDPKMLEVLKVLLDTGTAYKAECRSDDGVLCTLLVTALKNENFAAADLISAKLPEGINTPDTRDSTAFQVLSTNNYSGVEYLKVQEAKTLQEKNDLLHSAVINGRAETSKYLISKGAMAGYRKDGVPLIHLAAQNKDPKMLEVLKVLLDTGTAYKAECRSDDGVLCTLLVTALKNENFAAADLISAKLPEGINTLDTYGNTALKMLLNYCNPGAKYLVEHGADTHGYDLSCLLGGDSSFDGA